MLEAQLMRCETAFKSAITLTRKDEAHTRRHRLEGALSDAWQAYCLFVRNICIRSSTGCITANGVSYPPSTSVTPQNWKRVSYIATKAAKNNPIKSGLTNEVLRIEPTWGDSQKIVNIINALTPGNAGTLLGALAGGLPGPKHCQTVRNACAHRNHQTKAEVELLASHYIAGRIIYPTDALLWRDPTNSNFAFLSWLDDMRSIAHSATQ